MALSLYDQSRHTVVCQRPRKQKKTRGTQVSFTGTVKLPNSAFYISKTTILISTKFTYFFLTYTQLHISKLKEIALVVLEIFVPENCLIFFTFFFFFFFFFFLTGFAKRDLIRVIINI